MKYNLDFIWEMHPKIFFHRTSHHRKRDVMYLVFVWFCFSVLRNKVIILKLVTLTADLLTCMNAYTPRRNSMFDDPLPGDDLRGPPRPFLMYDGMLPVICDFSFCERGLKRASDRSINYSGASFGSPHTHTCARVTQTQRHRMGDTNHF